MQNDPKRSHQAILTNYMEILTDNLLDEILSEDKAFRLPKEALRDVKALALNRLWPMHLTTDTGKDFIKKIVIEDKIEQDVMRELRAALDIVRHNPRAHR